MIKERIAGIDIGTNTLLMVIGEVEDNNIKWLADFHEIARLGEGVDSSNIINNEAISRAENILQRYRSEIIKFEVDKTIIVGTSALRDANNSKLVKDNLERIINAEINIISGDKEALLTFIGTVENNDTCSVIDIGGGSTEFILANYNEIISATSLNIGAVRITERFKLNEEKADMIGAESFLNEEYSKLDISNWDVESYSVAGTPVTLSMILQKMTDFSREKIHNTKLSLDNVEEVIDTISSSEKLELVKKYGVNPNRADIILGGALILKHFVQRIPKKEVIVSCNGLRYGVVKNYLKTKVI